MGAEAVMQRPPAPPSPAEPYGAPPAPPVALAGPALAGRLETGEGAWLSVEVAAASRTTLRVCFPDGTSPEDRTEFSRLVVALRRGEASLGRCRLEWEEARFGGEGRLVFLDDVYDCRRLVERGELANVRSSFQNVPLVLSQKERVRPEFREYTADLVYDLSAYKKLFGEQEHLLAGEPALVARESERALLETEGRAFFRFFDARLAQLSELVAGYDREEHERAGYYLRRLTWDFILCSDFLRRTNLKPRGYAGDAEMMVMAYENAYAGSTLFGKLLHKHPLETPAAQAVRDRRRLVADVLAEVRARRSGGAGAPARFLSLAAGPAWELRDIFRAEDDLEDLSCVLLDQDPHALAWARRTVEEVEGRFSGGRRLRAEYLDTSVRHMLRGGERVGARLGRFDLVYSMGLFDYLTPPVARAVLKRTWELVAPGGVLLVGNYHVDNPTRVYMEYLMDWTLYHRTEGELLALAEGLPEARASVGFDASGAQMFLRLERGGG